MKRVKNLILAATIMMSAITFTGCTLLQKSPEKIAKTVVAVLNGENITIADLDKELKVSIDALIQEHGEDYEYKIDDDTKAELSEARLSVLNQLIEEKVLLKKVEDLKLTPSEEDLKKSMNEKIAQLTDYYGSKEELDTAIKNLGYTDETFNEFIKNRVLIELAIDHITKDVKVKKSEIEEYYNNNTSQYTQGPGAEAKHILFENEDDAKKCIEDIKKGNANFDDLFTEYLENASSMKKPLAEDLGFVQYEEPYFDEDFLKGFKEVKEGEISEPVKSQFGYHIIKVSNISNDAVVTPLKDVSKDIESSLLTSKKYEHYKNTLTKWEEELGLKKYENRI